ncbi:MAG: hypothetical protein ACRDH1_12670, partial [Actinomycetota bacterium]
VREQIASTVDLVVHTARLLGGRRIVSRVTSVEGLSGGRPVLHDVYWFDRGTGFSATGHRPQTHRSLLPVAPEDDGRVPDGALVGGRP